jgi:hypothetical protein
LLLILRINFYSSLLKNLFKMSKVASHRELTLHSSTGAHVNFTHNAEQDAVAASAVLSKSLSDLQKY